MAGTSLFTLLWSIHPCQKAYSFPPVWFYHLPNSLLSLYGMENKKMGSLDLNVVSCFAKSYFTQIEFAVWGEVKVQPICERQAEEQVTGRRHSAGRWFLGVCTRARHSNGESDNLSRNWSWLRTHNNYVNESKMQERSLFSWQIGTCWSDLY